MAIEPLAIGVCSWSLQVKNVPQLQQFLQRLGVSVVQIACGDPHQRHGMKETSCPRQRERPASR